jgi:hypothetical protein
MAKTLAKWKGARNYKSIKDSNPRPDGKAQRSHKEYRNREEK